ncbi:cholesterol side-chain cleavage enzyme, mitochondrial-like isoform X2 [Ornithorhynchus anatinus]|uniref:cholesterol side-chain cleavage enzyme, mitochondrial isoform X2 n=1 Tax=Ornithorhynchus anatinus TaxID=9258 RepID=UPI0010A9246D|nr:cholesterol side-chain cleavage enzyme, mitochondrial isoform X2 [Ornithorhynchus anatinus]XP_028929456.1 cholesterol side-chain cleavage enzyme, mitochondrial-like isoform X2 [Ornithorhynchus anatinus]
MMLTWGTVRLPALSKSGCLRISASGAKVWKTRVPKQLFSVREPAYVSARNLTSVSAGNPGSLPLYPEEPRPFNELPGEWRHGWWNLYRFWRANGFHDVHNLMIEKFKRFGPIYRNGEGWKRDRLTLNREALAPEVVDRFVPILNEVSEDFVKLIQTRMAQSDQEKLTINLAQELFCFSLESVCKILYGERLGLLEQVVNHEAEQFIEAVSTMFHTTGIMLYTPPFLFSTVNAKAWREHVQAWDTIFTQADRFMENTYQELKHKRGDPQKFRGILGSLLLNEKMSHEAIKANMTELMAGGVDTTSMTLQWALYELTRSVFVQEQIRREVLDARKASQGDMSKMLNSVPLLRAAIKETLRLHPVAVTIQRYPMEELVIQNFTIPPKTLVHVAIYAMGRDPNFFSNPSKFDPSRWLHKDSTYFRGLSFGSGVRQCLGRRIAETEMVLFLIHMLENFKIEAKTLQDVETTFDLILIPKSPIVFQIRPLQAQL